MTISRHSGATFVRMRTGHTFRFGTSQPTAKGFTIVEALVATVMLGVAGTAFAASLAVSGALRSRGQVARTAARMAADHAAMLAHRPCNAADTSSASDAGSAVDARWSAVHAGGAWQSTDSVSARGARDVIVLAGLIACR